MNASEWWGPRRFACCPSGTLYRALLDRALKDAKAKGHRLVLLVGDEAYYGRVGFKMIPKGRVKMPGPVDYARPLVAELVDDAFADVSGAIRPDWSFAR